MKNPRLLGVILDRNLHFGDHVDHLVEKTQEKLKMIGAVANTEGSWKKEYLIRIFTAFVNSAAEYGGFAGMPSAAKSHIERLEKAQNKALRLVTGQYMETPVVALRKECGLLNVSTQINRLIMKSSEKAIRLTEDHPRRIALEGPVTHTRKQTN